MQNLSVQHHDILSLSYLESGDRKKTPISLIFLHGFPDDAHVWSDQLTYFSKNFHCLAPFLPGTEASEKKQKERINLKHLIPLYLQFIHEKAGKEVILIGHDMGGPLAGALCDENRGDKQFRLILVNSLLIDHFLKRLKNVEQAHRSLYMIPFQIPGMENKLFHSFGMGMLRNIMVDQEVPFEKQHNNPNVFRGMQCYRSYWKSNFAKWRGKREWEVDLLFGKKEPFVARPQAEEALGWFNTCRLHMVEGGHWPFLSHALQFNETLDRLLKEKNDQ